MTQKKWTKKEKEKLLTVFEELYPDPESELNFKNDFELLISVILSAQCTDKKVNQVTPKLFLKYPNPLKLSKARVATVEGIIRQVNYYKTKSKNIINTAKLLVSMHSSDIPLNRKDLEALPGVGRKTASVVLSEKDIEPAFPVDTHVFRVSKRLELASSDKRDEVEEEVKNHFEPTTWRSRHHWLIFHGRRVCKARNPLCDECSIKHLCSFPD